MKQAERDKIFTFIVNELREAVPFLSEEKVIFLVNIMAE